MKRLASLLFALCLGFMAAQEKSASPKKVAPVFADADRLAIKGYDPVGYFTLNRATKGSPEFTAEHQGVKYQFSSAAHRDLFAANPSQYLPQFGGYCAWAVGNNYTAPADPEAWKIVEGKLYLNYNSAVQRKWMADENLLIRKGHANWPQLHN